MGRRTSSGRIGAPTFGGLLADAQTITSDDNTDIILDPTGTGIVRVDGSLRMDAQNELRFADSDNSNYVGFKAGPTISSNRIWTLPSADATQANQALVSDGSGNLSFATVAISITDEDTDSNTFNLTLTQSTSGTITGLTVSSSDLTYVPSTGTLSATEIEVTASTASNSTSTGALVVTGGVGVGGTLTVNELVETSSAALKDDISPIQSALDAICNLQGVTYTKNNIKQSGFIAEEVVNVLPDIVRKDDDNNINGIAYTQIIAYLVESVKELRDQLKDR